MALPDPNFIYCPPLQIYFVDKDTAEALSAGVVTFYEDTNRTVLKPIYQQVQLPDNTYEFVELNNPVTLTSVGTFADDNGNDIDVYLYPYEGLPTDETTGAIQLYYITVYSSGGILQITREAFPPNLFDGSNVISTFAPTQNELANPQFVEILFTEDPSTNAFTYSVGAGTTTTTIAPGWDLIVAAASSGTVTIEQIQVDDSSAPGNPPYALDITSTGLSSITLRQRLSASPRLLYSGFVAGYAAVRSVSPTGAIEFTMSYIPSNGDSYTIFDDFSTDNFAWTALQGTVAIDGTANTGTAPTGYVDIDLTWTANNHVQISSLQIVGVQNENSSAEFIQQSTAMQKNNLSYYYKPQLAAKPIPSYTIGWDFPFNPCQALGTTVTATALGANKSRYIADQTIAFEAVSNTLNYTFTTSEGLTVSTGAPTQFALVQYLDQATARELLKGRMAVKLRSRCSLGTLTGYVNIYWTEDATLPDIKSPTLNSLVSGLTLGVPAVANGTWNTVQRSGLGNAVFQLTTTQTEFDFTGWSGLDSSGSTPITGGSTAKFIAIVISFTEMAAANNVYMQYATLCAGDIATPPPAMNEAQTLQALQYYYEKSYSQGIVPGTVALPGLVFAPQILDTYDPGTIVRNMRPGAFSLQWKALKATSTVNSTVPTVTLYSPNSATPGQVQALVYSGGISVGNQNAAISGNWINTGTINEEGVLYVPASATNFATTAPTTISGATGIQGLIYFQYVCDARLGTF